MRSGGLEALQSLGYQALEYETQHKTGGYLMGVDTSGGHPAMDYAEHNRTYANFLSWTKFGIIFLVVLLAGMAYFLV